MHETKLPNILKIKINRELHCIQSRQLRGPEDCVKGVKNCADGDY